MLVDAAALPLAAGLLPAPLALVCWPGPVVLLLLEFELELALEVVCVLVDVLDEAELLVWDCGCALAEG